MVLDVQLELLLLRACGSQAVHVFHHQVPVAHLRCVRGVLQGLDEQGLGIVGQVGREFAHLVGCAVISVFEGYGQDFVRLQGKVERHVAQ